VSILRFRRNSGISGYSPFHGFSALGIGAPSQEIREMYWRYGQRILAAGKIIQENPRLFAVYITTLGCGPDSFISHFYRDLSKGKPYLQLEIDEHSADAVSSRDAKPSWTA